MSKPNNGGPAFAHGGSDLDAPQEGMTLRDYFAGHASNPPEEWLEFQRKLDQSRNPYNEPHRPKLRDDFELIADWKFRSADAMLRAREE